MVSEPLVTILIPNYNTLKLTQSCLQSLKKNTDLRKAKIIVIDNHSQDGSVEYLRSLDWIQLIERKPEADTDHLSHPSALDLAMQQVDTPYVLSIHTDTIVKNKKWLDFLLCQIEKDNNIAGVGSWKLEHKSWIKRFLKAIEKRVQLFWYFLINKKDHVIQGVGKNHYYLRSHCALYRTDLIKRYHLTFSANNEQVGKVLYRKLVEEGYEMIFLPSEILSCYLIHINHATSVLNPEIVVHKKMINKGEKALKKLLNI